MRQSVACVVPHMTDAGPDMSIRMATRGTGISSCTMADGPTQPPLCIHQQRRSLGED